MVKPHTAQSSLLLVARAALLDSSHASSSSSSSSSSSPSSSPSQVDGTLLIKMDNDRTELEYLLTLSVGTPPQEFVLQLDTGSSEMWLPGATSSFCQPGRCEMGAFNMAKSSTAEVHIENGFQVAYEDESHAEGDYITDIVHIGGADVPDMIMGYATDLSNLTHGLVGVGYKANEGGGAGSQPIYPNFPYQLCLANITNTVAYSLWLDDLAATTGTILFGGIDRSKYLGDLTILDFQPSHADSTVITEFQVELSGLRAVSASGTDALGSAAFPTIALLDSGTSLTYLPADLALQILAVAGAEYDPATSVDAWVPCSLADATAESTYFSYEFGGGAAVVNVSMADLVFTDVVRADDASLCRFGILPDNGTSGHVILGDTFLRSAYVVYDLVNNQAGLAQTNRDASADNNNNGGGSSSSDEEEAQIVPFVSSGAPIPFATRAPNKGGMSAVTTTLASFAAASGFANPPTRTSSSSSSSGSDDDVHDDNNDDGDDKSQENEVLNVNAWAIGGGAAAGAVLILASGAYAWRAVAKKRRNRKMLRMMEIKRQLGSMGGVVMDEAKAPLVATEQEYGRLTQVQQTAYREA